MRNDPEAAEKIPIPHDERLPDYTVAAELNHFF